MPGKSKGRLVHYSDFIGLEGRITMPSADRVALNLDAQRMIYPGSNRDAWWDIKQLLLQLTDTLDIFEKKHPDCVAVLVFDQSSAHASHGDGALNAFSMNLSNGGKQPIQKNTIYPLECIYPELQGTKQELSYVTAQGERVAKGLKEVLQERGCLVDNIRAKCKTRCLGPILYPVLTSDKPSCCLAHILSSHYNFYHQKSAIAILIEDRGHWCLFLLKFYCKLNPIEMY
jgi:hypothetical protein